MPTPPGDNPNEPIASDHASPSGERLIFPGIKAAPVGTHAYVAITTSHGSGNLGVFSATEGFGRARARPATNILA
jgi:hypothetical protein